MTRAAAEPRDTGAKASAASLPAAAPEATAAAAPEPPATSSNRPLITIFVIMATMIFALDSTIANVALPYMQGTMSASQDEISWVLTSYIVATAIMTAPVGFIAARFGRTRLFVISLLGFTLTSILCGAAQSLDQMIFFRILQGISGAPLVPLSQATLFDIYPIERRGFAMSLWTMGVNVAPILGPTLGGWLTGEYSWRWVFYINVPLGLITAAGILLCLKETTKDKTVRLDWIGFGTLSLAVGAFQTVLDRGETLDWFASPEVITETILACVGFYLFLVQTTLAPKPFLSPRLFTDLNFVAGTGLYFTIGLLLFAVMALLAPYLQDLMNYPVATAGIVLAPRGLGTMIAAIIAGRLVWRLGPHFFIIIGLFFTGLSLYLMTQWTPDVPESNILGTGVIQGMGLSFVTIPLSVTTFATLPPGLRTEAAGVYNLVRNLGSSMGISITSALLVSNTQINHADISSRITPFDRAMQSGAAAHFWNPHLLAGVEALNAEITRQANIIAYLDDFKLMLVLTILVVPLSLLIRRPRTAK